MRLKDAVMGVVERCHMMGFEAPLYRCFAARWEGCIGVRLDLNEALSLSLQAIVDVQHWQIGSSLS